MAASVTGHERTLIGVARQSSLRHDDAPDAYQHALEIFVRRVENVDPATELGWLKSWCATITSRRRVPSARVLS